MRAWKGRNPLAVAAAVTVALAAAAAVVVGSVYLYAPRATRVRPGDVAPDLTLPAALDGQPGSLAGARGGPALVLFFDTRWPGSAAYLRYLDRIVYRRYLRRGLRMVAVALDTDLSAVRRFIADNELTFTVLSDPDAAAITPAYGRPRDPEAYLLDPQGRVDAVFTARVDWADVTTRERIEKRLGPAPPGR